MPRKVKIKIRRGLETALLPGILEDGEFGLTTDTWKLFIGLGGQNIFLGEVGAFGDMLKSVYDTDNDGIVDQAEKVEWAGVLNKAIASQSTLGLIKVGSNLSVTIDGVLSGNSNPESFIPKSERFTVSNGQTTFNLTKGYYTPGSLTWSLYGFQQPKEAITEISGTSFSIPTGLPDGTDFEVQYIQTVNLQPYPKHKGEHLPGGTDDLGLKAVALSGSYSDLQNKPALDEISKKTLTGSVTAASYFAFAQTPINAAEYSAVFKITVTSTANASIGHVLYVRVEGHANTVPMFQVDSKTNNTSAATTGLYYLRGVYPKVVNSGSRSYIEFYVYDATKRDLKIELIESNNVDLLNNFLATPYNSTNHNITTPAVLYNGVITNGTFYGSVSGTATNAYNLYNDSFVAGEALIANDLIFLQTDNKWYKANVSGRNIPFGTLIGRCGSTYALNATVGGYLFGRYTLPTGVSGTIGKDMFIRGSLVNGVFTTDGTVTSTLDNGYSYIRVGSVVGAINTLFYDGNNRVYSIANGKLSAVDGYSFDTPTKLSEFENDIGAGGGIKITTSPTAPTNQAAGDFWYKEL